MIKGNFKLLGVIALVACGFGSQAFAQSQGCIALSTMAEIEKDVVNAKARNPGAGARRQSDPRHRSCLDRHG